MLEFVIYLVNGIFSFSISGLDDLILMLCLNYYYPRNLKSINIGMLISLNIIVLVSYLIAYYLQDLMILKQIMEYLYVLQSLFVIYIVYLLISFFNNRQETKKESLVIVKEKFTTTDTKKVIQSAALLYFMQGFDDFTIYTANFINISHTIYNVVSYVIGINLGLVIFYIIVIKYSKYIEKIFKT